MGRVKRLSEVVGRREHGKSWAIRPMPFRERNKAVEELLSEAPTATLKIRDDIEKIPQMGSTHSRGLYVQLAAKNLVVELKREIIGRSRPYVKVTRKLEGDIDTVWEVGAEDALFLLNPDTYGMVFEECADLKYKTDESGTIKAIRSKPMK